MLLLYEGQFVGRITFVGGYGELASAVLDKRFADNTLRWYDGTIYDGANREANDIPQFAALADAQRPDERPVLRYVESSTGKVLEVRSYIATVVGPDVSFNQVSHTSAPFTDQGNFSAPHTVYERYVIGAYIDGIFAAAVYYDVLAEGFDLTSTLP